MEYTTIWASGKWRPFRRYDRSCFGAIDRKYFRRAFYSGCDDLRLTDGWVAAVASQLRLLPILHVDFSNPTLLNRSDRLCINSMAPAMNGLLRQAKTAARGFRAVKSSPARVRAQAPPPEPFAICRLASLWLTLYRDGHQVPHKRQSRSWEDWGMNFEYAGCIQIKFN